MCGLSGLVRIQEGNISDIVSMNSVIRHRGPDDEGYLLLDRQGYLHKMGGNDTCKESWAADFKYAPESRISENGDKPYLLAFGHRRLSILDLSAAGHQPMSYLEGRFWIVFNGQIYNHNDIRAELQSKGYQFTTRTDTEVVLAAYAAWSEKCLEKFVGMWSLAIYDHKLNEVFLSRDRYGIKPLYYWFSPDESFYFASEIKQFTVCSGWTADMNRSRVCDYLIYSFTDHTDETMFSGVYQLPAGSYFRSGVSDIRRDRNGRIRYVKWYKLIRNQFSGSFQEAATSFRSLFEQAVSEHLMADVPVGTALSGGLDSSSIVCEVNRILRNNGNAELQKTFSSCAADERYNEKRWMDIVTEHIKVDSHIIYPQLQDAIDTTKKLIWYQDEPYQSQSAFLGFKIFGLARENGVKVLLNGQGADEYLGGYGQFAAARYADMVRQFRWCSLNSDIRNLRKIRPIPKATLLRHISFHLIPSFLRGRLVNITGSADLIRKIVDIEKLGISFTHPYDVIPVKMNSVPEISEHLTFYSTLPKYLRWEDRNSMAHSIEARVPFLDHRLVEFAYSLPDDFLDKDGVTKRVMREAMDNLLPEKIKNRKDKMGFTTPEELWIKKEKPDYFRKWILEAISVTDGIIKPESVAYFDRLVKGEVPFDYTYWRMIMFSEWIKQFSVIV